jgi:hypothetical protein
MMELPPYLMEASRISFFVIQLQFSFYPHNRKCSDQSRNLCVKELAVYKEAERELQMYLVRAKMKE